MTAWAASFIGKIFDLQVIQRQQEISKVTSDIAQQVAPLLYSRVGNLLVGEDTAAKVALHALVGGLISQVIGGNFSSGAIGAGAAAFAVNLLADQIQSIPGISEQDGRDLVQLLGLVVGKIAEQVAGGTATDGNAAGVVAKLATEFNFLKHQQLDAFKTRYSSCTTDACRTQVFAEMKALSDAQDAQLKTCTTSESCKGIATGEFNPLQQSYMGLFNSSTTDLLNFCNAGDTACSATLNYIAQHSNVAMIASNDAGADSLAGANALLAATVAMAKSFQAQDPELDAAKAYAKALLITASPGFAAALGSTVGSYSASATNALNLAKTLASQQQLSDMAAGKFSVIAGSGSNTILTDAPRLVAEYGGSLGDWSKISSSAFTASDGTKVEVHAYRNALTGAVVEPKSIQN